jgi:hypothetical protein
MRGDVPRPQAQRTSPGPRSAATCATSPSWPSPARARFSACRAPNGTPSATAAWRRRSRGWVGALFKLLLHCAARAQAMGEVMSHPLSRSPPHPPEAPALAALTTIGSPPTRLTISSPLPLRASPSPPTPNPPGRHGREPVPAPVLRHGVRRLHGPSAAGRPHGRALRVGWGMREERRGAGTGCMYRLCTWLCTRPSRRAHPTRLSPPTHLPTTP